jgi:hypothetical protein
MQCEEPFKNFSLGKVTWSLLHNGVTKNEFD